MFRSHDFQYPKSIRRVNLSQKQNDILNHHYRGMYIVYATTTHQRVDNIILIRV